MAEFGVPMHSEADTPTEPRSMPNHTSLTKALATVYLTFYKTAKAVGEMLLLTEAPDPFMQDLYEAPLGAVEKTETHSGAASGSYRMITDLSCNRDGRA